MITQSILAFLKNREWNITVQDENFIRLKPPLHFQMADDFEIYIPQLVDKIDFNLFIDNTINILSDLYALSVDDLNVILKKESTVFKVRIYDEHTEEGKISLIKFEGVIEKIKTILSDAASFVIDRNVTSTRVPEEVNRYLSLCNFLQTETGSFVANIQLPSKQLIKEKELFDRDEIFSEEINQKLSEVLTFVKEDILEGNEIASPDYLLENESRINIKMLKDIELLFNKNNLKNVDFGFHSIENSNVIINTDVTKLKLNRLSEFVDQVESNVFEIGIVSFKGRVVNLKSKDPDGLRNGIMIAGIHNDLQTVGIANLNSEHYKLAIEAHKTKQNIAIDGLAKTTKTRIRFIEVNSFVVEA